MVGVFVAFIRVVYGRTIYMSLPIQYRLQFRSFETHGPDSLFLK